MALLALVGKEWLLLRRDWHGLLLLFVMPAAFILVMSLAMQNVFSAQRGASIHYFLLNGDHSAASTELVGKLEAMQGFKAVATAAPPAELRRRVQRDEAAFLVEIPGGFGNALLSANPLPLSMSAGPAVEPAVYRLFEQALRAALMQVYLQQKLAPLTAQQPANAAPVDFKLAGKLLHAQSLYHAGTGDPMPSSVQQSVPAWLLFAMFFIAIPLSTTWVQERQQGTSARLRSMGVNATTLLLGKLLPYVAINLLQVALMLAIGVYLVPWLGGEHLALGQSPAALAVMALAASFAAVAYALLIANLVSTAEQATIFTGVANLLMAAAGGIMVPVFIMPPVMQAVSRYSPMGWGLKGFLDVFLRQGGLRMVAPQVLLLLGFGLGCLLLAGIRLASRRAS